MKTFGIVLLVVTISTALAIFTLTSVFRGAPRNVQKTGTKSVSNPGQKLRKLMLENPTRWGKEQFHDLQDLIKKKGSLWMYLAFLAELCFIRIPVREVEKAVDLYGLRHRRPAPSSHPGRSMSQQHLRGNTTPDSSYRQGTGEANSKSLARQIMELQLAERECPRKGPIFAVARKVRTTLSITVHILLLCVWIPLLLLEYVALIFCCPFIGHVGETAQRDSQPRASKREQLKHFFTAPLVFLGLDLSQSNSQRRRSEHEHRSPAPSAGSFDDAPGTFPQSYLYPGQLAGDRLPIPGRGPHTGGTRSFRNLVTQPTFQAYRQQYPSGPIPAVVQPQLDPPPTLHLRRRGYSDVEGGTSRRAGGVWADSERGFVGR